LGSLQNPLQKFQICLHTSNDFVRYVACKFFKLSSFFFFFWPQICRVLSAGNNIETILQGIGFELSPGLVKRFLANCHGFEESTGRLFLWAKLQRLFDHNSETYDEMVKITVRKRYFKFVAHLLAKMKLEGV
jgi:hypothetical protein